MWITALLWIGTMVLTALLAPRPQPTRPPGIGEVTAPTADEGREIPVLFGCRDLRGANVVGFGNVRTRAMVETQKGGRRYGVAGPRKTIRTTIGYNYFVNMHMVLCLGPVDWMTRIDVGEKQRFLGQIVEGGTYIVTGKDAQDNSQGGSFDLLRGMPDQQPFAFFGSLISGPLPAYRGVTSIALRDMYIGDAPYIDPWSFRCQRIFIRSDGSPQWYPLRAPIASRAFGEVNYIYFALDRSGSMGFDGGIRMQTMKEAMALVFDVIQLYLYTDMNIRIVAFGAGATAIQRNNVDETGLQDLRNFVNGLTASGGTNFDAGVNSATGFFSSTQPSNNLMFFVCDGEPTGGSEVAAVESVSDLLDRNTCPYCISQGTDVKMYGINIVITNTTETAKLDNMQSSIPVIAEDDPGALAAIMVGALVGSGNESDMNPVHVIRECLTDKIWGMGYPESDIDDANFRSAADRIFSEQLGFSVIWDRQKPIEDFVVDILAMIDASLYVDRKTGLFTLRLIRDDYDINQLTVLDFDSVSRIEQFQRRTFADLINQVSVVFQDGESGQNATAQAMDIALIHRAGTAVGTTVQYPGVSNHAVALRLSYRDMRSLSVQAINCTIYADRTAHSLNIGDAFILDYPRYGVSNTVMRVADIALGDGRNNVVRISATQDVYSLPEASFEEPEEIDWVDPGSVEPVAVNYRWVGEAPFVIVRASLEVEVGSTLASNPGLGYNLIVAARPLNGIISALIDVEKNGVSDTYGSANFNPAIVVAQDVGRFETLIPVDTLIDWDELDVGILASWDDEIVRLVSITGQELEIERGMLDTIPQLHTAGSAIITWDDGLASDGLDYIAGDEITTRLLSRTMTQILLRAMAPIDTTVFNSRAIRPYPAARLTAFGELEPDEDFYPVYPIQINWFSRNRLTQLEPDYIDWLDAVNQTAEADTTYRVTVEALQSDMTVDGTVLTETVTATSYSLQAENIGAAFAGSPFMKVTVTSVRGGFDSWQSPSVTFRGPFNAPSDITGFYKHPVPPKDFQIFMLPPPIAFEVLQDPNDGAVLTDTDGVVWVQPED